MYDVSPTDFKFMSAQFLNFLLN